MHTNTLFLMLFVSLILGLVGLLIFLWGLKGKQFSDEKKMLESLLYDGPEDLNLAKQEEELKKKKG
ncbi:cbb3-type cytochrome oxidase assembly protein CcoS [Helicobacter bizzozeronii]|uniref:Putative component of cation transport for cbb3-type oxidase n=1 Tax=Helicobacter bizzozeronii (strain CIII-1) TaxID=1002804 RepID=F8KQA5_HELBC|nr:cbb3-type cytochrome oxidase assembly protein CcoS [Helicobacter bizzozeronii]GMB92384.1 Cation transport subunit for cbb3-type oxidase FixS [Helicobacter bizzozeronii]GMT37994.1 Cation transport subunit for cbb3-type oxidase FixS [Helicobacter bizzozeronii]CCB80276.1 putative component of cation transport for cbb3-type oxidase [Helicobacter bizzozeronii CIII-1]